MPSLFVLMKRSVANNVGSPFTFLGAPYAYIRGYVCYIELGNCHDVSVKFGGNKIQN